MRSYPVALICDLLKTYSTLTQSYLSKKTRYGSSEGAFTFLGPSSCGVCGLRALRKQTSVTALISVPLVSEIGVISRPECGGFQEFSELLT